MTLEPRPTSMRLQTALKVQSISETGTMSMVFNNFSKGMAQYYYSI